MASNKTEHYQLNQWEATDQVLRTDFNADNQKLDSALHGLVEQLAGKLGRSRVLKTVKPNGRYINIDLSDVDWSQWEYLAFGVDHMPSAGSTSYRLLCQLNKGQVGGRSSTSPYAFADIEPMPFYMILLPRHSGANQVQGLCIGNVGGFGIGKCTFQELNSIDIMMGYESNSDFKPDLRIDVVGIG